MTLILTIGNKNGLYQSSDYQLTDAQSGGPVSDKAGSKQIQASIGRLELQLAFTGVASVGVGSAGRRTVDWLADELKALKPDTELQEICNVLAKRSAAEMKPLGESGLLTLVVAVSEVEKPFRVAVVSNADWTKSPPRAKATFAIRIHTITKPFHLISGLRSSVSTTDEHRLRALARNTKDTPQAMLGELTAINVAAASNSKGWVSEECWVTSQVADGRMRHGLMRSTAEDGSVPTISRGTDVLEFIRKNFRAAPGKEIRLVQGVSVSAGRGAGTPVPPPEGEPRTFNMSAPAVQGVLRSAYGQACAEISLSEWVRPVTARRNEQVIVDFANVKVTTLEAGRTDSPRPLYPWPQLPYALKIDGVDVPRGWEQKVGFWIDKGRNCLAIPSSSRGIRSMAFLGDDDELVIVAPIEELRFEWSADEKELTGAIKARVWWRQRLDGTKGPADDGYPGAPLAL